MKISCFIPSYKRADIKSPTQVMFPFAKMVVKESEAENYRETGNDVITCPDKIQGHVGRVRNWILDNYLDKCDVLVMMDDDYSSFSRWEDFENIQIENDELIDFIVTHSVLCNDWGFKFWGVNCRKDKRCYLENVPFNTLSFIGGPFQCHLKGSELRFDEQFTTKDDYDMFCQQVHTYGGALRVNYVNYICGQSENEGGIATYRNIEVEKDQLWLLQKKWGKDVMKRDKQSKRGFDINPIVKIPIKGL